MCTNLAWQVVCWEMLALPNLNCLLAFTHSFLSRRFFFFTQFNPPQPKHFSYQVMVPEFEIYMDLWSGRLEQGCLGLKVPLASNGEMHAFCQSSASSCMCVVLVDNLTIVPSLLLDTLCVCFQHWMHSLLQWLRLPDPPAHFWKNQNMYLWPVGHSSSCEWGWCNVAHGHTWRSMCRRRIVKLLLKPKINHLDCGSTRFPRGVACGSRHNIGRG